MYTYKSLKHLEKRCIKNNGQKASLWDDDGIKINNRIYRQMEYGGISGVCYVTFRNTGKVGRQKTYANRENIDFKKDRFVTIEYYLIEGLVNNTYNIFEFVAIRETL